MPPDELAARLAGIADVVRRDGFHVQCAQPGVRNWPYAYTVGLTALGHPELVVSNLSPDECLPLLGSLCSNICAGGRIAPGAAWAKVGVFFTAYPESVALAGQLYPDAPVRALQLVLHDSQNRFPWQAGCLLPQDSFGYPWVMPVFFNER